MSSLKDFAQRLNLRIQAEYGSASAALVARAGLDSLKDCEIRGQLNAMENFQVWINTAMKEMNEDNLDVPFRAPKSGNEGTQPYEDSEFHIAYSVADDPEDEP